jgi:LmbE family N-acetylglucosaminyl deacetylase
VAVLALAGLTVAEAWRRHQLYWYDVQRDYAYEFTQGSVDSTPVHVSRSGFEQPAGVSSGGAALLELRVTATLAGWWFEPCLDLTIGDRTEQQCFERGAKGRRYVLLPSITPGANGTVRLRGRHLKWLPQEARLLRFPAQPLHGKRVLVLAPHPDDAEIAAFGLYASTDAFVATITAGNYVDGRYGGLGLDTDAQDRLRGEVRVWDSLAIPQLGGVPPERTVNLGYLTYALKGFHDASHGSGTAVPAEPVGAYRQGAVQTLLGARAATPDWASLVGDLRSMIQSIQPTLIVAPHPALDDHTDHQFTTIALLEALEALGDREATLLLYNNHHRLSEHYPYGPATAIMTLPPWFGGAPFSGLLSYPLDDGQQLRKLFALEAMHDLRAAPMRLDTGAPAAVLVQRLKQAFELVRRDPFGDYSYFRRAVRPNELFFVYSPEARPTAAEAVRWVKR